MLSVLKWLLVLGTLAALFALVPVGGRTLLERAELIRGGGRAASAPADAREEEDAPTPAPRPERRGAPERARPAPLPREKLSASDHAAVDRLITERAR